MLQKCYQSFVDLDALKTLLNNCKMAGRKIERDLVGGWDRRLYNFHFLFSKKYDMMNLVFFTLNMKYDKFLKKALLNSYSYKSFNKGIYGYFKAAVFL